MIDFLHRYADEVPNVLLEGRFNPQFFGFQGENKVLRVYLELEGSWLPENGA